SCQNAFRRPVPLLEAGFALAAFASAMIDISDGLLVDLDHICQASGVGAQVDSEKVPVTKAAKDILNQAGLDPLPTAITFGDDYQLLCCLPPEKLTAAQKAAPGLTAIGVIAQGDKAVLLHNGQPMELARRGYEHGTPDENNAKEKT
ncbi:MAG: thiamine-phosphate kinase, partial [Alphaproteobacteria bacterium]